MVDHIVDATAPRGRVEIRRGVVAGGGGDEDKGGSSRNVCTGRGRVGGGPAGQHLFACARRRHGQRLAGGRAACSCRSYGSAKSGSTTPSIMIETDGSVVRVGCGVDVGWLAAVLRVVKGPHDRPVGRGARPGGDAAGRLSKEHRWPDARTVCCTPPASSRTRHLAQSTCHSWSRKSNSSTARLVRSRARPGKVSCHQCRARSR